MSTEDLPELPIFGTHSEGDEPVLPEHVQSEEFHEAWSMMVRSLWTHLNMAHRSARSPAEMVQFGMTGLAAESILIHAAYGRAVKVNLTPHLRFRHPVELPDDFESGLYVFVAEDNRALCAVSWAQGDIERISEHSSQVIASHLRELGESMNLVGQGASFGHDNQGRVNFDTGDVQRDVVQEFRNELDTPIHEELIEQFRRELEGGES